MLSQSNEVRTQATERLFLAVVNQAISDVLENGNEAKEDSSDRKPLFVRLTGALALYVASAACSLA